jgi:hypothetical protein
MNDRDSTLALIAEIANKNPEEIPNLEEWIDFVNKAREQIRLEVCKLLDKKNNIYGMLHSTDPASRSDSRQCSQH